MVMTMLKISVAKTGKSKTLPNCHCIVPSYTDNDVMNFLTVIWLSTGNSLFVPTLRQQCVFMYILQHKDSCSGYSRPSIFERGCGQC